MCNLNMYDACAGSNKTCFFYCESDQCEQL